MAELVTLARPYAEAVFRLGREQGKLAAWSASLAELAAIAVNVEVAACLGNPNLTAAQKADLVSAVAGKDLAAEAANLLQVLAANERLALLPEIADFYESLKGNEEGIQEAIIYSAFELGEGQQQKLLAELEVHFNTKLKSEIKLDPELIGGIKVVVGDQVLDASVRGKLAAMATALRN